LRQARNEAALDRGVRIGEFGAMQDLERERLEQQAGQFGLGQDLERERLEQQAGQFATTGEQEAARLRQARNEAALDRGVRIGEFGATQEAEAARLQMAQEQIDLQKQREIMGILGKAPDKLQSILGYKDEKEGEALRAADQLALLEALGYQRSQTPEQLAAAAEEERLAEAARLAQQAAEEERLAEAARLAQQAAEEERLAEVARRRRGHYFTGSGSGGGTISGRSAATNAGTTGSGTSLPRGPVYQP